MLLLVLLVVSARWFIWFGIVKWFDEWCIATGSVFSYELFNVKDRVLVKNLLEANIQDI